MRTFAILALFALVAVAMAAPASEAPTDAPAQEQKADLQTAQDIGLGYGLYGGIGLGYAHLLHRLHYARLLGFGLHGGFIG